MQSVVYGIVEPTVSKVGTIARLTFPGFPWVGPNGRNEYYTAAKSALEGETEALVETYSTLTPPSFGVERDEKAKDISTANDDRAPPTANSGVLRQRRLKLNDRVKSLDRKRQASADAKSSAANTPMQVGDSTDPSDYQINNN